VTVQLHQLKVCPCTLTVNHQNYKAHARGVSGVVCGVWCGDVRGWDVVRGCVGRGCAWDVVVWGCMCAGRMHGVWWVHGGRAHCTYGVSGLRSVR
jgi:hypothetical protein